VLSFSDEFIVSYISANHLACREERTVQKGMEVGGLSNCWVQTVQWVRSLYKWQLLLTGANPNPCKILLLYCNVIPDASLF